MPGRPGMQDYAQRLRSQAARIGVWGAGHIGVTTLVHYAQSGVSGLALDVVPEKVAALNQGVISDIALRDWLRFDLKRLRDEGRVEVTLDARRLFQPDVLVHFICIPTEREGHPDTRHLEHVVERLCRLPAADPDSPPLVIIESTLTPGTTDGVVIPIFRRHGKVVGRDVLVGVAPRRDWFVDRSKSLKELDRVFGGCDARTTGVMREVLGIVCDHLHAASSHRTAEMVKSFENAYRHMEITLANQLSLAYPNENVREALRLAGTKWNIGTFYPGFGVGGYCIPLSSRYVIEGAERPEALSILAETIKTDGDINRLIARSIAARGLHNVGVLGLAYKADLKISSLSPTIPFVDELRRHGVAVKVCDPLYEGEEISRLAGVPAFSYPAGLSEFDAVVLIVGHAPFRESVHEVPGHLTRCRFVLDNAAAWCELADAFGQRGVEYRVAGDAHWLGTTASDDTSPHTSPTSQARSRPSSEPPGVLVTGAAGYVGSWVTRRLLASGFHVVGVDNLLQGGSALLGVLGHARFRFVAADVRDSSAVAAAMRGLDHVVHLAAIVGEASCDRSSDLAIGVNLIGTQNVAQAARASGVQRFIFFSTCSSYGVQDTTQMADESTPVNPVSLYAKTKIEAEQYLLDTMHGDTACTIFRPATVHGTSARMRFDLIVNHLVRDAAMGRRLSIYGPGLWRPLMWVGDAARAVELALRAEDSVIRNECFNVGATEANYRKRDIAEIVQRHCRIPVEVEYSGTDADLRSYRVDFSKIRRKLGFTLSKSLDEAVEDVFQLFDHGIVTDPDGAQYGNA